MLPVLSGLSVIAVEQYGAGPYSSMQLADLGAEIIKIETRPMAATWRGGSGHILSRLRRRAHHQARERGGGG